MTVTAAIFAQNELAMVLGNNSVAASLSPAAAQVRTLDGLNLVCSR
jgi:hypothetical protein